MQAEFRPPKRRTRVQEQYEGPLPVLPTREKNQFRAELINQHVLVCDPDHIQKIHNQGYFGKGILSRARPEHSISDQWEQREGVRLPVVSQSRYEELLRWAGSALSAQGLDEAVVHQVLHELSQSVAAEDLRREFDGSESNKRCRTETQDLNPDQDCRSDQDSRLVGQDTDTCSGPVSSVPGPGYVLVEVEGGVREVRRSPFRLPEYLQLGLEEAFFLVYSLGCLSVYVQQKPLSILQLWRTFRSLQPDFLSSFAAYHHYRSRGWVPKGGSGAKYGVDFMLYRKGPPFYHSSYSVVVKRTDGAFGDSALHRFSWRSLAGLSRITANVSKELLLCHVIHPTDLSEAELDSPECVKRLKIQEVLVSRWISSRERAEQDDI